MTSGRWQLGYLLTHPFCITTNNFPMTDFPFAVLSGAEERQPERAEHLDDDKDSSIAL